MVPNPKVRLSLLLIFDWKYCFIFMTFQSEYKVICCHECVTGYGATRGGAMRPQAGNTFIVNMSWNVVHTLTSLDMIWMFM